MSYMPKSHKRFVTVIISIVFGAIAWALSLIIEDIPPLGRVAVILTTAGVAALFSYAILPIEMKND